MNQEFTEEEIDRLYKIFAPKLANAQKHAQENNKKFVHYTNAEAAFKIIKNSEVWLRNTTTMNDYSEVLHGIDCLVRAHEEEEGKSLKTTLNKIHPNITEDIARHFNGWQPTFKNDSYIFCISEHEQDENNYGRLSMWRAYGKNSGVALVLNNDAFLQENDDLPAYTVKVEYTDYKKYKHALKNMQLSIEENIDLVSRLSSDDLLAYVFEAFKLAALSIKHEGFSEEKEWRVIYNPKLAPSDHIKNRLEIINGIPQEIQIIKLENIPEINLKHLEIHEIINRIIIGPSDSALSVHRSFVSLLKEKGVPDAEDRVFTSDIPLR